MSTASTSRGDEIAVSRFAVAGLADWKPKSFKGHTEYRLVRENGQTVVKATSRGSASGLVKEVRLDPRKYRYLRWSWKIDQTVAGGDERTKGGDDYAARIYVVFRGRFFWQTKAISYIWANRLPKGDSIPNSYTSQVRMVAVESGPSLAGRWVTAERDILADYRRLFGGEPGDISAIAIMTDTDNTGGDAIAWYGDISISTEL